MNRRVLTIALVPVALATAWWAWKLRPQPAVVQEVGPPRSDYTTEDYHLVVMNKDGKVSFRSTGPYAARDPDSHELFLNTPKFSFPDRGGGGDWNGHSQTGWVSANGEEVRLKREVVLDGPVIPDKDQAHLRTEQLSVFPDPQTAHGKLLVTVTRGATILTGVGLNAWLKTSRFELLSKVSIHDVPAKKD